MVEYVGVTRKMAGGFGHRRSMWAREVRLNSRAKLQMVTKPKIAIWRECVKYNPRP